jgi:crossover junction endodeoxyribonuclease RuvC
LADSGGGASVGGVSWAGGKTTSVAYGHLSTDKNLAPEKRLEEIARDLGELIRQYEPEEAAVEELFFFKNQKTIISVAQARGVILLTLENFCVSISGYTPLEVKQALTNYGRAEKAQVQLMVQAILKLPALPTPDDTADALAIALCHASRRKVESIRNSKS